MSYSLVTSKRKFHKILDSLTNSPTTKPPSRLNQEESLSVPVEGPETPSKRRRINAISTDTSLSRIRPSDARLAPVKTRIPLASKGQTTKATHTLPNYAPWDRGQFLERLKTFRHVDKWSPKPPKVNEVEWARRGWRCVGKERVGCIGGCERQVLIKIDSQKDMHESGVQENVEEREGSWDNGAEDMIIERYARMIVDEHAVDCLWKKRGCDDKIYRLPLAQSTAALAALRTRYQSLLPMSSELPTNILLPAELDTESLIQQSSLDLLKLSSNETADEGKEKSINNGINKNAFILAIFGWRAEEGQPSGLATCEACFRRLGLWLFKDKPASEGKIEESTAIQLDVIEEHRYFCPWINESSQCGSGSSKDKSSTLQPGWQILLRAMKTAHHFRAESQQLLVGQPEPESVAGDDEASEAQSVISTATSDNFDDRSLRDAKDKERWTKLRRLKRMFDVRKRKTPGKSDDNGPNGNPPFGAQTPHL